MTTLALPDANVLYSRTLRDWLLLLKVTAEGGMFQVAYTEDILAEVIYQVRRARPDLSGFQITTMRDQIVGTMDFRIEDYPSGQSAVQIADPFDRHVHAAAVAGQVHCIITNDSDFTRLPDADRDQLEYEIYTPDEFFCLIDDSAPRIVRKTLRQQIDHQGRRQNPTYDFQASLQNAGCPEFAARVKLRCQELAVQR